VLKNLRAALDQKGITLKALAAVIGVSEKTAWNKINEETVLSYPEASVISRELFPEYKPEYLFASDEGEVSS